MWTQEQVDYLLAALPEGWVVELYAEGEGLHIKPPDGLPAEALDALDELHYKIIADESNPAVTWHVTTDSDRSRARAFEYAAKYGLKLVETETENRYRVILAEQDGS